MWTSWQLWRLRFSIIRDVYMSRAGSLNNAALKGGIVILTQLARIATRRYFRFPITRRAGRQKSTEDIEWWALAFFLSISRCSDLRPQKLLCSCNLQHDRLSPTGRAQDSHASVSEAQRIHPLEPLCRFAFPTTDHHSTRVKSKEDAVVHFAKCQGACDLGRWRQ